MIPILVSISSIAVGFLMFAVGKWGFDQTTEPGFGDGFFSGALAMFAGVMCVGLILAGFLVAVAGPVLIGHAFSEAEK
jgi:hypothetical protein